MGKSATIPIDNYRSGQLAKSKHDALHGSLDLLVLKTLEEGPMHGWAITLHVEKVSNNVLRVEEGSLIQPCIEWNTRGGSRRSGG